MTPNSKIKEALKPIDKIKLRLVVQDRKTSPRLRCLAMDLLDDLSEFEDALKGEIVFIRPLSTENPFIEKMGLGEPLGRLVVDPPYKKNSDEKIIFGGVAKKYPKNPPPTFRHWMEYQKVRLKPSDKRYQKYYSKYRKFKNELKKNSYTK